MNIHIYSVEANSQVSHITVYIMTTQICQSCKIFSQESLKFIHFAGKFSRGPQVQKRVLLGLCICLQEYNQRANFEIHLILGALTSFYFSDFKKRFDMLSQCLVPHISKKVNCYSLVLGQKPLIALQTQCTSMYLQINKNIFNSKLFLQ